MILVSLLPMLLCKLCPRPASSAPTWLTISPFWNMFHHGCLVHPLNVKLVNGVVYLVKCLTVHIWLWSRIWWDELPYIHADFHETFRPKVQRYHVLQQKSWRNWRSLAGVQPKRNWSRTLLRLLMAVRRCPWPIQNKINLQDSWGRHRESKGAILVSIHIAPHRLFRP